MAAAAALGEAGFEVELFEARPFLGGRAASYECPIGGVVETIDNCQHILLRCCVNLLDFYRRLGVEDCIRFYREFHFLEPGGRRSRLTPGLLPPPAHFAGSFLRLKFLSLGDKIAIARALRAMLRPSGGADLDSLTMAQWLASQRQPRRAVERFWRPILLSAVNEELDRMAASHGFQVFRLGFLGGPQSAEMGVPGVGLSQLYAAERWRGVPNVRIRTGVKIDRFRFDAERAAAAAVSGTDFEADYFISAVPFHQLPAVAPEVPVDLTPFEHSPITGIHLWFDRPVTELPHAALLDRTIQWFFDKREGQYLQLVVSASRTLTEMPRGEVIELALTELREFLPAAREAKVEKAHVVKEMRATFSAAPGLSRARPGPRTRFPNFFLAGDWTATGWPATMEGAVRSGYLAAEAVSEAAGRPAKFLKPGMT